MQTSWLKDLVSVVDPTHHLSFLNYLVTTGRLFAMLNSQFDVIPRREYQQYLAWAAGRLDGIAYGVDVDEISFDERGFQVSAAGRPLAVAEHLVLGVGTRPVFPAAADATTSTSATSADASTGLDAAVAVVGGGQTGAEAVLRLLSAGFTDILWIGRGAWFRTIDDSPVANDFYRPEHVRYLQGLALPTRRRVVEELRTTADALTPGTMRTIYQANYEAMLERSRFPVRILVGHDVTGGTADRDDSEILLRCKTAEHVTELPVRYVVVAVGREFAPIPFAEGLRERIEVDERGALSVEADYSARWKGMNGHRIYVLNRARFSHGIPDANLTLLPVRAALGLNSMFEREIYPVSAGLCTVNPTTAYLVLAVSP
jgi:lysine/ornithine N-monooxygenase